MKLFLLSCIFCCSIHYVVAQQDERTISIKDTGFTLGTVGGHKSGDIEINRFLDGIPRDTLGKYQIETIVKYQIIIHRTDTLVYFETYDNENKIEFNKASYKWMVDKKGKCIISITFINSLTSQTKKVIYEARGNGNNCP